jgi:hypothetical protein
VVERQKVLRVSKGGGRPWRSWSIMTGAEPRTKSRRPDKVLKISVPRTDNSRVEQTEGASLNPKPIGGR